MSKMHSFKTSFERSTKLRWLSEVAWFGQSMVFQTDYDKIQLHKISYDVTSGTSITKNSHQNNVTNCFHFGPLHCFKSKFLATPM